MPMNAKIKSKIENSTFSRHEPTLYTLHGYRLQGGGRDIIEKRENGNKREYFIQRKKERRIYTERILKKEK